MCVDEDFELSGGWFYNILDQLLDLRHAWSYNGKLSE